MNADVQAFKDKMAEKAAAKAKVMVAIGKGDWTTVTAEGLTGTEGKAMADLQKMADTYVNAHPEQFTAVEGSVSSDGHDHIVKMIDIFYGAGMEEEALKMTMFELAKFERQQIGVATRAKVRVGNGG